MAQERNISTKITGMWKPGKPGEKIIGFYNGFIKTNEGYVMYMVSDLKRETVIVIPSYAILERFFQRIEENEFVHITFTGSEHGKNNDYFNFDTRAWILEGKEPEVWDKKCHFPETKDKNEKGESEAPPPPNDDDIPF